MPDRPPLVPSVAPCHNEEPNVEPLYRAIRFQLHSELWKYQLVLVDEGSGP